MKLLAIETSTMLGGVALMEDDVLIAETRMNVKTTHSERIMADIDNVLKRSGFTIGAVDVFGIASGPGSFTGLRVGLSTLKGLSYATGRRIVSVSTLEAMAWNLPFSQHLICPVLDARKKELYAGIFEWRRDGFTNCMEERTIKVATLLDRLHGMEKSIVFLGEGVLLYKDQILSSLGARAIFPPPQHMAPSAANVAYLCMKKARRNEFDEPAGLVPRYMRKSEAEIKQGL
jgi:tRNA threonylcarbamoyladenosine biosynthesis protein TsaB